MSVCGAALSGSGARPLPPLHKLTAFPIHPEKTP